jgi:hypothetical protein
MYLDDAAPDVSVPGFEHEIEVELDGVVIETVHGTGDLISLAGRKLALGPHEVLVGSSKLRFNLVSSRVEWTQDAQIAHNLRRSDWGYLPTLDLGVPMVGADVAVSGAAILSDGLDAALDPHPPMMVRVSARGYLALGPPGFVAELDVDQPAWARRRGLVFNAFELAALQRQVSFPVLWVARLFATRAEVLRVATPAGREDGAPVDLAAWRSAIKQLVSCRLTIEPDAVEAWDEYLAGASADA